MTKYTKKHGVSQRATTKKQRHKFLPQECLVQATFQPFEATLTKNNKHLPSSNTLIKDIRQVMKPSKIRPQDDFYSYINDKWIKEYKIPEKHGYIIQQDDFRIVQDQVYRQLLDIVRTYLRSPASHHSPLGKSMRAFYHAEQHYATRKQSKQAADQYLAILDQAQNPWDFMGYLCKNEIISWGSPFVWSLNPDDMHPDTFRCYVDAPQVTLIDLDVYFDDLPGTPQEVRYRRHYKATYLKFLHKLFSNVFGTNYKTAYGFHPKDVFAVELDILNAMGCESVFQHRRQGQGHRRGQRLVENPDNYYRITPQALQANDLSAFDWTTFSKAIGFKNPPEFFITSNPDYIKCGAELVTEQWQTPKWRSYWAYIYIRQQQRWAEGGHHIFYDFHGKFVRGQAQEISLRSAIKPVYALGFAFNTFLTEQYIKQYENPAHVAYVKNMAEDLKAVFIRIIERNTWLQPATKAAALKKLRHFELTVASPPELRADPALDYSSKDPWANLCMLAEWRAHQATTLEGRPVIDVPAMDWAQIPPKFVGTQAYVVNAAYTPAKNGIYIPLGYVQPPFVDLAERGIEYNLAHIGYTLAHEMSHSLDDWGSRYDYTGRLNNWWTPRDTAHFKKIQQDVIKEYETYAKRDGIIFDAAPSIGEDLADISGVNICMEYLRDFQLKNADILPIKALSFEAFFVYFAYQQRQKISRKAIQAQLKTNPHPLDKYRTNVPLSRLPLFRTLYKIERRDGMWWSNTNRVWED